MSRSILCVGSQICGDVLCDHGISPVREVPLGMVDQQLMHLTAFDADYRADVEGNPSDGRVPVDSVEDANVITSIVKGGLGHRVVLDIDLPAVLVPSTTPGHHHLYIDCEPIEESVYLDLLRALCAAGIIEEGYYLAADRRKHTAVRLPWIKKEPAPPADPTPIDIDILMED